MAAFFALRGILPSTFLSLPLIEQIFMHAAMENEIELETRKLEILAGVRRRK